MKKPDARVGVVMGGRPFSRVVHLTGLHASFWWETEPTSMYFYRWPANTMPLWIVDPVIARMWNEGVTDVKPIKFREESRGRHSRGSGRRRGPGAPRS